MWCYEGFWQCPFILFDSNSKDFLKLDIVEKGNFNGNPNQLIKNNISIGKELSFDLDVKIYNPQNIKIGNNCNINSGVLLQSCEKSVM